MIREFIRKGTGSREEYPTRHASGGLVLVVHMIVLSATPAYQKPDRSPDHVPSGHVSVAAPSGRYWA